MPTSPGNDRAHNEAGATVEAVAEWATNNYAELRRRRDRNAGADLAIPLDPFATKRRPQRPQPNPNGGIQ